MVRAWFALALLIGYGSLFPFAFERPAPGAWDAFFGDLRLWTSRGDVLGNVVLFLPYGLFGWHALRGAPVRRVAWLLGGGLGYALLLQLGQLALPMRSAALADVFWNGVGLILGLGLAPVFGARQAYGWSPARQTALGLLLLWSAIFLLPLVPSLDRALAASVLRPLLAPARLELPALLMNGALGWLGVRLLAACAGDARAARLGVLLAAAMLAVQPVLIDGHLSLERGLGLLGGALIASAVQRRGDDALLALLLLAYLTEGLMPFALRVHPAAPTWLPFEALLAGDMLNNSRQLALRITVYAGVLWLLARRGTPVRPAALALMACVVAVETAQLWLQGRSGDLSEAVWVALAGWALARIGALAETGAVPPPPVPAAALAQAARGAWRPAAVALLAALAIALALRGGLRLPGMPYNVLELFRADGALPALFAFALALLWLGVGATWLARALERTATLGWRLPLASLAVAEVELLLLLAGVNTESLDDIIGSPDIYRQVVAGQAWGAAWSSVFQHLPTDFIGGIERALRFPALVIPWFLAPALMLAGQRRWRAGLPCGRWLAVLAAVGLPWLWLCSRVVYDWASTDNLTELIAGPDAHGIHGGYYLSLVPFLLSAGACALAGAARRPLAGIALPLLALPLGWWLLAHGLEQHVEKYGFVFPAQQFLLGPDREHLLDARTLMLRGFALQGALMLALALGLRLGERLASAGWRVRAPLPACSQAASVSAAAPSAAPSRLRATALPWRLAMVAAVGGVVALLAAALPDPRDRLFGTARTESALPRWRAESPRILLPELAGWSGRGRAPAMAARATPEALAVCGSPALLDATACWLLQGDAESATRVADAMRRFVPVPAAAAGEYGNAWALALAYDLFGRSPDFDAAARAQMRQVLGLALDQLLEVLDGDGDGASLWHGRATLAAHAWLCAAALGPDDSAAGRQRLARAARHFRGLLEALALTEAWPEGYNYWIQNRALPIALAAAAYLNGIDGAEDAAAVRALLARIGRWHVYATRPDGRIQGFGDEGSRVDLRHHTRAVIDLLAQLSGDSALATYSAELGRRFGTEAYTADNRWAVALLREPALAVLAGPYPQVLAGLLPPDALFGRGAMNLGYWRSGWSSGATSISFRAGDSFTHHGHYDAGHFTLFKGAPLAVDGATYGEFGAPHRLNYAIRSVAKNTLLVLRPGERVSLPIAQAQNVADGGQRLTLPTGSAIASVEQWREALDHGPHLRGARLRQYASRTELAYAATDLTEAYNTPRHDEGGQGGKVERVERELVYLRAEDRLIVHDRVRSTDAAYVKKWLLHVPTRPQVAGLRVLRGGLGDGILESEAGFARIDNGNGALALRRLLPRDARLRLVGGPSHRYYVERDGDETALDGVDYAEGARPAPWFDADDWRIEIQPGAPRRDDEFLVVLSPALGGAVRDDAEVLASDSSMLSGVVTPVSVSAFVQRGGGRAARLRLPEGRQALYVFGLPEYAEFELAAGGGAPRRVRVDAQGIGRLDLAGVPAGEAVLRW